MERAALIVLRLALGLLYLMACACCAWGFCVTKSESIIAGTAVATVVTFFAGLFFLNSAADESLWKNEHHERVIDNAERRAAQAESTDLDIRVEKHDRESA